MRADHRLANVLALLALAVGALAVTASPAAAAARKDERIELRPLVPVVAKLEPKLCDLPEDFETLARLARPLIDEHEVFELTSRPLGPAGLDLTITPLPDLELSVAADMFGDDAHPMAPRIDCDTRECYFWLRAAYDLTPRCRVFFESFQGASSVLGGPLRPRWIWDGFQVEVGMRLKLDRYTIEGGPVLYTLSASRRPDQLGCRLGVSWEF